MSQLAVRCRNPKVRRQTRELGGLLCVVSGNHLYVRCPHSRCHAWTELSFTHPGIKIDFERCAISQRTLERRMHFNLTPAPVTMVESGGGT